MPVVVTGCQGQLGAELCRQLGDAAAGLDLPALDLTDRAGVLETLHSIRPRAVVNAAAYTLVDRAEGEADLCRAVNVQGVAHLVEACQALGCTLVQMSTDYVFGRDAHRRVPYRETDEPGPLGVYAQSKLDSERVAAQCPRHLIVRSCGLYGRLSSRSAGNFVETMLRAAAAGRPLRVVADQRCTPSSTRHVVRAVRFLMSVEATGLYHVTSAGEATWFEFAMEIFRRSGIDARVTAISSAEWGAAVSRPAYSVLDCSKYRALPGAPPLPPWQDALAEYLRARGSEACHA